MQPMGRRKKVFSGKQNNPKWKGGNWWEDENNDGNKKCERRKAKEEILKDLAEY